MDFWRFAALLVCLWLVNQCGSNCPLSGCTPTRSFTSGAEFFNGTFVPQLLWSAALLEPSGAGCVTNGARIVCPMADMQE